MYKEALNGPWAQALGTVGTSALAGGLSAGTMTPTSSVIPLMASDAINAAQNVGSLSGILKKPTREDIKNYQKSKKLNLIPGVSAYRMAQRRKQLASRYTGGAGFQKPLSQSIGPFSSAILLALAGAGIGAGIGAIADGGATGAKTGLGIGAAIGGGLGLGASSIGGLAALLTKTRDAKGQKKYEQGATAPNYIIPGMAAYNGYKSLGHILNSKDYLKNL